MIAAFAAFEKDRKLERKPGLTHRDIEDVITPVVLIGTYLVVAFAALRRAFDVKDTLLDTPTHSFVVIERVTVISPIEEIIHAA